jgi:hypothetical protein
VYTFLFNELFPYILEAFNGNLPSFLENFAKLFLIFWELFCLSRSIKKKLKKLSKLQKKIFQPQNILEKPAATRNETSKKLH